MIFSLLMPLTGLVFVWQLAACWKGRTRWVRLLPLLLLGAFVLGCGCIYFYAQIPGSRLFNVYGAGYAAFAYGYVGLVWMGTAAMAWGVYGILWALKKRQK